MESYTCYVIFFAIGMLISGWKDDCRICLSSHGVRVR